MNSWFLTQTHRLKDTEINRCLRMHGLGISIHTYISSLSLRGPRSNDISVTMNTQHPDLDF